MKRTMLFLGASALLLAACQQQTAKKAEPGTDAANQQAAGPPPMPGDPSKNPDMTGFAKQVDTNGDGKMSRAEWQAQGLPDSSFNMFEQGRGFVALADFQKNAAPPGIDINGDGKLTVAEFKEFDSKMAPQMPKDGKAPAKP